MTPLTPADFHDRLDSVMPSSAADGALHPAVEADLAAGRRLLRRRRGATVLGAVAAVVLVAGSVGLAVGIGDEPSRSSEAAATPNSDAELMDACRTGNTSDAGRDAIFGTGTPTVKAIARSSRNIVLALESGDGAFWGDCFVNLVETEFTSGMSVYDATKRATSSGYAWGWACGLVHNDIDPACRDYFVNVVDRRPSVVAAIEFLTADGETTRVETVDGYYAFTHVARLPETVEPDADGTLAGFNPLKRITFLDASGTPIAAEAQDGSGAGVDGERVGDLPSITKFPSLRGDQQF